jgi:hypothetical protein
VTRFFLLATLLVIGTLAGCTTVEPISGPDGSTNELIHCPDIKECYNKAAEVCGGQYTIINTSTSVSGAYGSTSSTNDLLIKCK